MYLLKKYLLVVISLFISLNFVAQNTKETTRIFIRVYDLQGKKINRGNLKSISKTSIELILRGKVIKIPVSKIGKIRTKHSEGNNIAKGALIGGGSFAIIGFLSGDDEYVNNDLYINIQFSRTFKASMGLVSGCFFGAIVGAITSIFKESKLYIIDGNIEKLNDLKQQITIKPNNNITQQST